MTQERFANALVQKHNVYFVLLWQGFCSEFSALPAALTKAGLWGTTTRNRVCAQLLMLQELLAGGGFRGGCVVLVVGGWFLKTGAFFLIVLEWAN